MIQDTFELNFSSLEERAKQYNARASVADFDACVADYATRSAQAKRQCVGIYDLFYGQARAERLDLFPVVLSKQPAPLFVFIHGGYWHSQAKEDAPVMAKTFTDAGIAVCTLEYTLLPESTLSETVRQIRSAIAWLYRNAAQYGVDPERIFVSGSSAGGHLTGMVAASGWQAHYNLPQNVVKGVLGLSGLYDLQPLCGTYINDWMRLHPEQAQRLSPLFHLPDPQLPVLLAVGGLETDGFKNQTAAYESACRANGNTVEIIDTPNNNHFDLVCELADGQAALTQSVFSMILGDQTQDAASQQQVATSAG